MERLRWVPVGIPGNLVLASSPMEFYGYPWNLPSDVEKIHGIPWNERGPWNSPRSQWFFT